MIKPAFIVMGTLLLAGLAILPTSHALAASTKPIYTATLTLKPGESGHVSVTVNPHPKSPSEIATLEFSGTNTANLTNTFYTSSCQGTVGATGGYGQTLWTWTSYQAFQYDYSIVILNGFTGTPTTNYIGWSYDHNFYGSSGNYSSYAHANSKGYFTYLGGAQKSWGGVSHDIYSNGTCNISFQSGSW